jgi:hypothetical protein
MKAETTSDLDLDVRILRRNLAKGFVSQETVEDRLSKLPDTEDQAEWFDPEADGGARKPGRGEA